MNDKTDEGCCEHGDHPCPADRRFCSEACARCEHESENEETGCDGICGGDADETVARIVAWLRAGGGHDVREVQMLAVDLANRIERGEWREP